jgi:hypothetical protein
MHSRPYESGSSPPQVKMRTLRLVKGRRQQAITQARSYDKWLAYGGVVLGAVLTLILVLVRLYQPLGLTITIQVTSVGYLLLKNHLRTRSPARQDVGSTKQPLWRSVLLAGGPTIIVAAVTSIAIATSINVLQRPVWVFLALAGLPGFILAQHLFSKGKADETALIVQTIMLALAIVLTSVTVFPYNGGDTWAHLHNAEVVSEQRSVQAISGAYRDYPLYPALISVFSRLTNWSPARAARSLNIVVVVICLLLLYSLSRQSRTPAESLILALLLLGSKWFAHWTTLVVSMNMALLFFCLLVIVLFRRLYKKADGKEATALVLVSAIAPFFHPVGAVAIVFLLAGFWALETFYRDARPPSRQRSLIGLALFVIIVTLAQWMYFGDFIFDRTIQSLVTAIFDSDASLRLASSNRDPVIYTLDQLSFYCLLGLAGMEVMRQLGRRTDRLNLVAGLLGLAFVVFGYATQAVSLQAVLPYRWFLFGTILLIFPASSAFANLFCRRSKWLRVVAVGMIVVYCFIGVANTEVNRDRPFYGKEVTQLFGLTSPEYAGLLALQATMRQRDVRVRVDFRLWDYLKYVPGHEQVGHWQEIQLDGFDGVFAFRSAYWHHPLLVNGSASQIDRQQPNLSQFYDSGEMQLLDRADDAALE